MKRIHDYIYDWVNPYLDKKAQYRVGELLHLLHTFAIFSLPLFVVFYPINDMLFYMIGMIVIITIVCNLMESGCFLLRLERKLLDDRTHIGFYKPVVDQFDIPTQSLPLQSASLFFFAAIMYLYVIRLIDITHYRGQAIVYATICGIMWYYSLWYIKHPTLQLLSR